MSPLEWHASRDVDPRFHRIMANSEVLKWAESFESGRITKVEAADQLDDE